jgi:hypothetical protein
MCPTGDRPVIHCHPPAGERPAGSARDRRPTPDAAPSAGARWTCRRRNRPCGRTPRWWAHGTDRFAHRRRPRPTLDDPLRRSPRRRSADEVRRAPRRTEQLRRAGQETPTTHSGC